MSLSDCGFGFEHNENVVIAADAPAKYRPSRIAWVIACRVVESDAQSRAAGHPIGTALVLVEYEGGSDCEVPIAHLRHR